MLNLLLFVITLALFSPLSGAIAPQAPDVETAIASVASTTITPPEPTQELEQLLQLSNTRKVMHRLINPPPMLSIWTYKESTWARKIPKRAFQEDPLRKLEEGEARLELGFDLIGNPDSLWAPFPVLALYGYHPSIESSLWDLSHKSTFSSITHKFVGLKCFESKVLGGEFFFARLLYPRLMLIIRPGIGWTHIEPDYDTLALNTSSALDQGAWGGAYASAGISYLYLAQDPLVTPNPLPRGLRWLSNLCGSYERLQGFVSKSDLTIIQNERTFFTFNSQHAYFLNGLFPTEGENQFVVSLAYNRVQGLDGLRNNSIPLTHRLFHPPAMVARLNKRNVKNETSADYIVGGVERVLLSTQAFLPINKLLDVRFSSCHSSIGQNFNHLGVLHHDLNLGIGFKTTLPFEITLLNFNKNRHTTTWGLCFIPQLTVVADNL